MEWEKFVFVFVFVLCFWMVTSKKSLKCSTPPVHQKLDMDKFLGTWYTVSRTKKFWGDQTFESASYVFAKNPDDTLSYSFTGQMDGVCVPVETGVLEPGKRLGEFTMKGSMTPNPRMIISYTDYKTAMVHFCYNFRGKKAVCRLNSVQVEILTKSVTPKKKHVDAYISRARKRLCVKSEELFSTTPGECSIPDILEAARKAAMKAEQAKSKDVACTVNVNDIPIVQDIEFEKTGGTWYELARTRNTFNKMESAVTFAVYDEQSGYMTSYYTGTMPSSPETEADCVPPWKALSKRTDAESSVGDLVGKMAPEDSPYPWAPIKVLYADDQYIMSYACYTGETDGPCAREYSEVSIVGRTRELNSTARENMIALLPSVCMEEEELLETRFLANCSSMVVQNITEKETAPTDCLLDSIIVYDDFTKEQMRGRWYLYASIHFNSSTAMTGVIINKLVSEDHPENPTETEIVSFISKLKDGDRNCTVHKTRSRERCLDTADQITTLPFQDDTNFVFSKILHLSDSLLIEYFCTKPTLDGRCEMTGILFNVYKNITIEATDDDELELELISNMAKSVCLDPDLLEFETEWCSADLLSNATGPEEMAYDDVDILTIYSDLENFHQHDLYGYWYLIAHSNRSNELEDLDPMVAFFTADSNSSLLIYYTGNYNGSESPACSDVKTVPVVARCAQEVNGDYLIRYTATDDYVLYAPFKVLHVEKDSVLVTFVCQHVLPNGRCNVSEAQVRIWGRSRAMDEITKTNALEKLYWINIDPTEQGYIVDMVNDEDLHWLHNQLVNSADPDETAPAGAVSSGSSLFTELCDDTLKEYLTTNNIDVDTEEEDDDNDDDDDDSVETDDESNDSDEDQEEKKQKDQHHDEDNDLERELFMDDDEFYYGG